MENKFDKNSPYYIDHPSRIKQVQKLMAEKGIDVYIGSRLRTMSWITDVFCPWRSFVVIPSEGLPTAFIFVIDAARVEDETWLPSDNVRGYAPMGGQDQLNVIANFIKDEIINGKKGRIGVEAGMSNYLPEGNLTYFEYKKFEELLSPCKIVNALDIIDEASLIKDLGTINRFRKASEIVDIGHKNLLADMKNGGWKGMTETEIAGLAAYHMRKAGSLWEWSFTGGNEIASGYRTGMSGCACTPATNRTVQEGDSLMVDIHAMYGLALGDHSHNYFLGNATDRQLWHAKNFVDIVSLTLENYKAGASPISLAEKLLDFAESRSFSEYMVPGFEHGIGMLGDEWRIGMNDGPFPYWTNPEHVYQENEMLICAMQYACPEEDIGFRYENPILILKDGCEYMSKFPLTVDIID